MSPGPLQILIVVLVIALIVGPSRVSRMVRSLGRGAYDFIDELGSKKEDEKDEAPGELEAGKDHEEGRRD